MRISFRQILGNLEEIVAGGGFVAIVAITLFNILNRYVFKLSAAWAPELAGFVLTWIVFMGASAAWKRKMHVSISVLVDRLPPRMRAHIERVVDLILLIFLAYATYLALRITFSSHSRLSPVMHLPFSYVYVSAAVAFGTMFVWRLLEVVSRRNEPPPPAAHAPSVES